MNQIILLFTSVFYLASPLCSQVTLELSLVDCDAKGQIQEMTEFQLFYELDLIGSYKFTSPTLKIENLKKRFYRIQYTTVLKKMKTFEIDLTAATNYTLDFCIDASMVRYERYSSMIDQLKDGESGSIELHSAGCFHSFHDTLVITKEADFFLLNFNDVHRILNEEELIIIKKFEMRVFDMRIPTEANCTTNEFISIQYKGVLIEGLDYDCQINGVYYLLNVLQLNTD